ncbi:MAG: FAD-binding oxidoreductase [Flavobacteriaceae bacterium]|nr:FAD-binding oxidoreductase [Flavobacteriaceae bacterium]
MNFQNNESITANAVVIGAGTIGAATAWHLAKQGMKKVILIDRNNVGSGNTSKAASLMTLVRSKEALIPLIQETYKNIDEIEAATATSVGKNKVGTLHIAASKETATSLDSLVAIANKHGIANRPIDKEEIASMVPWLQTNNILKASYMKDDSFVDAYVLATTFAEAAKQLGVTVMQHTEVEKLLIQGDTIVGLQTSKGQIDCDYVVDAAGAWGNTLSMQVNVPIPMAPVRSIYWITEANETLFSPNQPMITLPDAMAYTRPEAGGLLFGLREENSPHFHPDALNKEPNVDFLGNPEDRWDIIVNHGEDFMSFFPEFEKQGVESCITGISTYTPDGYYSFGPSKDLKGFYVAAGCAGAGVAGSGGIGRMIAEMITNKPLFADEKPFAIDRFENFDPMSKPFRQRCADARSKKKDGG